MLQLTADISGIRCTVSIGQLAYFQMQLSVDYPVVINNTDTTTTVTGRVMFVNELLCYIVNKRGHIAEKLLKSSF